MPKFSPAKTLQVTLKKLMAQRGGLQKKADALLEKIAEIDAIFSGVGISMGTPARVGRKPAGRPAGKKRRRGKFTMTGEQSVLKFIEKHGKPSAKEVNAHWKEEGRGGSANNTLTRLFQTKKIKRVDAEDARGGRYVIA